MNRIFLTAEIEHLQALSFIERIMTFPPIQIYVLSHIKKSNADLTESTSSHVSYVSYCSSVSYQCVSKGCVTGTLPSAACFYEVRSRPERPGDTTRHAQLSAG